MKTIEIRLLDTTGPDVALVVLTPEEYAAMAGQPPLNNTCEWTPWREIGEWVASCGTNWTFDDATPTDAGMKFCPGCGLRLVEMWGEEESGEEE